MSVQALSWVLEHSDARLADRLVLLVLADHAKADGTSAWPSIDTIALQARVSRRTAIYSLQSLEAAGSIVKTGTSRAGTSVWTVAMAVQTVFDGLSEGGADIAPADSAPVQSTTDRGAESAPDPSRTVHTTPPNPPRGVSRGRTPRSRTIARAGGYDPDRPLDEFTIKAYRIQGVDVPDGASGGEVEAIIAAMDGQAA